MKTSMISLALCGSLATGMVAISAPAAQAKPGGCMKYGAAGAVAGHYAGGHAVRGFMAGCATGMYRRHLYNKQMKNGGTSTVTDPKKM